MKILFITHRFYPDIGGIEVNSEILASAFVEAGHDLRLLTWSTDTTGKFFPYKIIRNPNKLRLLQEHAWADVVFENNPCLRMAWPAIFFKKPSVVALRTWVSRTNGELGWQDRLKLLWLRRATATIAVSEAVRRKSRCNAVVIGNPYRTNLFRIIPAVPRNNSLVYLGRLVSDKGIDLAIKALYKLSPVYENLSLTIIGSGPERESLEKMVLQFGLEDRVKFMGALRGQLLVNCLNSHKILLVPSIWEEPFGNIVLEGMACGCIPIVSDGGGLPDAVGDAGLKFQRGDVDALSDRITEILENGKLEMELKSAAYNHLAIHHPDLVSRRYLNVIEEALSKTK
ncbi:glycosyl transferase group 1 [Pontibacter korlensis]|uniref:Glycosyl transferase group 1 n=1 Tax=Pontibacter korlensis TaxID=400092 RepID=A0A0E3UXX5_9BACT|nr:glycosyltransferase family 4 protein [Pontibacter korlensis]AKD03981.1 glycosyl transferase group 1 [Pontibacter korlensis]